MKRSGLFILIMFIVAGICTYMYVDTSESDVEYKRLLPPIPPPIPDTCIYSFIDSLEIPETKQEDEIISHTGYSFLYNEDHEQSNWVAYLLTEERAKATGKRNYNFRADPAVKTGTATDDDYKKSEYDRGHLAPFADMRWSETAMYESFFFSNMSPQLHAFNDGIWKKLEELGRYWAIEYDTVYIVTGPILRDGLPVIGKKNKISVPEYFYKVFLNYTSKNIKGIGFIMPNEKSNKPLQDFAITIDSVEAVTGINFFYKLSKAQEECAEATFSTSDWIWSKKEMTKKEQ